ncbi:proteasome inhibitor PI31 subunit isoform X2 [Triplophysa dalaica]|uniref:proteasome inhibitor PI31 subunit isoform X2 n=1 Tax=Triplophysa dalaica TaxID=1582913 RepID=UPI0024DF48DD|nr:proteasome inhibitor PI31 subunit isoform X2 [Triplophysa dalaica]
MAGLELLFNCVSNSISCSQDALICFVHWEIVKSGYKCLGIGDEPANGEKKSELLPAGWNGSKELYTLRYRSKDDKSNLLLKAFTVDSTLIFNLMDSKTEKVTDLTVNVNEYIAEGNLQTFESVFKNTDELIIKLKSSLLPPEKEERQEKNERKRESEKASNLRDSNNDPLLIPHRAPPTRHPPDWARLIHAIGKHSSSLQFLWLPPQVAQTYVHNTLILCFSLVLHWVKTASVVCSENSGTSSHTLVTMLSLVQL